ncbi:MAG TPA: (Fe-S)-binding protein [Herpetosiphonaceae bacterium]|nr:(Fe-S)-binding protein [Herpetosiphonaceae bacterium]
MTTAPRSASLFVTCIVDMLYPEIGESVVAILERLGVEVRFPADQTCCGQPAFNSGHWDEARAIAGRNIEVLRGQGDIVCPSGSCTSMLRHFYAQLFEGQPEMEAAVHELADRSYELTEYLVDVLGVTDVGAFFPKSLTVHDACHGLRGLHIKEQPRALLRDVEGADLVELPGAEECCGFGGLFSVKLPHISEAMLQRKVDQIESTGAEVVVTCDASCMTQINGRLSRQRSRCRAMHIAEVLAPVRKETEKSA